MKRKAVFLFYTVLIFDVYGQETFKPDSVKPQVWAIPTTDNIRLDGKLQETSWTKAKPATSFTQVEPNQEHKANDSTEVRILYDDRYIYVAAFCRDTLGTKSLKAPDLMRDFNWRAHDTFAIVFDGFCDHRNGMSFVTNPYGAQKDYLSFDDTYFDSDWNGLWQVRTSRSDSGWVAEFAIPWKTLRYAKKDVHEMGINFLRLRRESNEISVWSKYPRSYGFSRMEYAGILKGIQPPPPGTNLQVNPYVLFSRHDKDGSSTLNYKIGGEAKWAINPNTVADFTFNTDFAQADADLQVNNITRFSVFFPEKRQFFLENASLFGPGISPNDDLSGGNMIIQPFFSRRIGLDALGNPIPIDAGARTVYRSSKRSIGAMVVRQHAYDTLPVSHFATVRYTENIGKQNRLGVLVTTKSSPGHVNAVTALDGFFRFKQAHSLSVMAMHSGTTEKPGGLAAYGRYFYTTNRFKFWLSESVVTKDFNPEAGFVSRQDVVATAPGFFWYYRGQKLPYRQLIRSFEPGVASEFYHSITRRELIERSVKITPVWLTLQTGGYIGFSVTPSYQHLSDPFQPLGVYIPTGQFTYTRYALSMGSNASRKVSYILLYESGSYFNGRLDLTDVQLNLSPLPNITLRLRYNDNYFQEVGDQFTTQHVRLYTTQLRLALNPRLQLVGLFQKNTQTHTNAYNVRLSWEYKPLSYVYLVYNSRASTTDPSVREVAQIAKVSFLKQF
jgi:hypothetical protein